MGRYITLSILIFTAIQNLLPCFKKKHQQKPDLNKLILQNKIDEISKILKTQKIDNKTLTENLFFSVKNNKHKIARLLINYDIPTAYYIDIPQKIEEQITDKSFKKEIAKKIGLTINDLRLIKIVHFGFDKKYHTGKMIVHKKLAKEVVEIFTDMCKEKYPIKQIKLIDEYDANDDLSMKSNNSSALCQRYITGSTNKYSRHSHGTAIDINPIENPYVKENNVYPPEGKIYKDRTKNKKGLIKVGDACWKAFTKRGWNWGGNWKKILDYQHFEKDLFKK